MSNVLPPDGIYNGALISTKRLSDVYHEGRTVVAECGAVSASVFGYALRHGLGGAEALYGIPGTVGGMAYSNAGAFGYEFSDFFVSGRVYIPDERKILTLGREELNFKYRESEFSKREMYLLSAKFSLRDVSRDDSLLKIKEFKRRREETQPIGIPSLGSVFKRGYYGAPAKLIDKLGLKGYSVGGAEVSDKHAGFIINRHNASSSDFKATLRHVKESVYNEFGVLLELEIELLS
jgi:UDP-N-acetylmuramate dehydrogenase